MGSVVSQIYYWDGTSDKNKANSETKPGSLSYDWYLILSVLGGFLGLDHLYLRSPSTAILKFFVNIFFYGAWWLFDALNAFFNRDIVKVFGVGIPGLGPYGIGAGCLAHDIPDKNHVNFFSYSFGLGFGGLFGLDSYMVGNTGTALLRLMCLVSIIGAPIAFLAWFYEIARWLFLTTEVIEQYPYFGRAGGPPTGFFAGLFKMLPEVIAKPLIGIEAAINAFGVTADTITTRILGLPENVGKVVKPIGDILSGTQSIGTTPECVKKAVEGQMKGQMKGGGKSDILPYMLIGTIGIITLSGLCLSYIRSKKPKEKTDPPPEPQPQEAKQAMSQAKQAKQAQQSKQSKQSEQSEQETE